MAFWSDATWHESSLVDLKVNICPHHKHQLWRQFYSTPQWWYGFFVDNLIYWNQMTIMRFKLLFKNNSERLKAHEGSKLLKKLSHQIAIQAIKQFAVQTLFSLREFSPRRVKVFLFFFFSPIFIQNKLYHFLKSKPFRGLQKSHHGKYLWLFHHKTFVFVVARQCSRLRKTMNKSLFWSHYRLETKEKGNDFE